MRSDGDRREGIEVSRWMRKKTTQTRGCTWTRSRRVYLDYVMCAPIMLKEQLLVSRLNRLSLGCLEGLEVDTHPPKYFPSNKLSIIPSIHSGILTSVVFTFLPPFQHMPVNVPSFTILLPLPPFPSFFLSFFPTHPIFHLTCHASYFLALSHQLLPSPFAHSNDFPPFSSS